MEAMNAVQKWILVVLGCVVFVALPYASLAADLSSTPRSHVRVMFMVKGSGQESSQVAENTLTQAFLRQGYQVIDAATVAQALHRSGYLLKQSEVEAAKRLGAGLGADIVVSGEAKSRVTEKTYTMLEGKKVIGSQGNVSLKAVLAKTGRVIAVVDNASGRKPFDTTGEIALQMAAESAAGRLLQGLEEFLNRDTIDYRLGILDVIPSQSLVFGQSLRHQLKGVRQVNEPGVMQTGLQFNVSVEKKQDLAFKQSLLAQLSSLGLGPLELVAVEGENIILRQAGGSMPARQKADSPPARKPSSGPLTPPITQDPASRQPPGDVTQRTTPPSQPADGLTRHNPNYRKSWAVLIGINEYQQWPKLQYAVNDARAVEKLVRGLGFDEVIVVLDSQATRQHILRVLGDELFAKTQDDDRVFIFFAGHGQTQDLPNNGKDGYIIPVDGDLKDYYSTAISMLQLQGLAARTRAKHMFYAIDACFSGLLRQMRVEPTLLTRQVLTAGSEGEQVVELGGHGLFTKSLLDGLAGAADIKPKDDYITGSELYEYIAARVLAESRNSQNPVFARLDSGQGEFVFGRK